MTVSAGADLFVGVDVGTSGCRAMAIDTAQQIHARAQTDWPTPVQHGNRVEQDADIWWQGLCTCIRDLSGQIDPSRVRALALDATSGSVLLADAAGIPLTPGLMYNDRRAVEEAAWMQAHIPAQVAAHGAGSGLAKLLWLARQDNLDSARYFLHQADWLLGRLCGRFGISDYHNALKTGYDPAGECWPDWLRALPVPLHWLPEVLTPGRPVAMLLQAVATQLGLPTEVCVVTGTTDSTAAFLATGADQAGDAVTSLGSTLVVKVLSPHPVVAPEYGVYAHRFGDLWLVGGASNSGGAVLRQFFTPAQMQSLTPLLDPDTPTGLDYYPLPGRGERFPVNAPEQAPRLQPRPKQDAVFFQGLLEGIARIEYTGYQRLAELGAPWPTRLRTVGGGSHNPAWTRIRQRMLSIPMQEPRSDQAAFGAALLARQGYEHTPRAGSIA